MKSYCYSFLEIQLLYVYLVLAHIDILFLNCGDFQET